MNEYVPYLFSYFFNVLLSVLPWCLAWFQKYTGKHIKLMFNRYTLVPCPSCIQKILVLLSEGHSHKGPDKRDDSLVLRIHMNSYFKAVFGYEQFFLFLECPEDSNLYGFHVTK